MFLQCKFNNDFQDEQIKLYIISKDDVCFNFYLALCLSYLLLYIVLELRKYMIVPFFTGIIYRFLSFLMSLSKFLLA